VARVGDRVRAAIDTVDREGARQRCEVVGEVAVFD
jgi:hypothetical protein